MFSDRQNTSWMFQLHGPLNRLVMTPHDRWQTARISRLERISRAAEINNQRELEEIMATLDNGIYTGICDDAEKQELAKRRKRKFMDIAVPHGIITCICMAVCVVYLVNTGKQIELGGQMEDYFSRQTELDHIVNIILREYGDVIMAMTNIKKSKDMSQTYDLTDREIEKFLSDKNLVKWTILNMLRDYRSSEPSSDPFHAKVVKHARFYSKVVTNVKYTAQDEKFRITQRQGWKLAYDFQLKTRQYFNVRLLILTLEVLENCLKGTPFADIDEHTKCMAPGMDDLESFKTLEDFITDMLSLLNILDSSAGYLSMSFRLLRVLHQLMDNITYSTRISFSELYSGKVYGTENLPGINRNNTVGILHKGNDGKDNASDYDNETDEEPGSNESVSNTSPGNQSNTTVSLTIVHNKSGTPSVFITTTTGVSTGFGQIDNEFNNGSDIANVTAELSTEMEHVERESDTISDIIDILRELQLEIRNGLNVNLGLENVRNRKVLNVSAVWFTSVFLAVILVILVTALLVSLLRTESELVVCVGDWLKHVTNDLTSKRESLHGIMQKVVPHQILADLDFDFTIQSTMIPYHAKEATFFMFSISHFTSYFDLFTTSQTIHILTLVMELVDERIEQYDTISVAFMGQQRIVFSDTTYCKRAHHASEIANLSLDIMSCCSDLEIGRQPPHSKLHVSIGIHTGPCVGMLYIRNGVFNFLVTGSTINVLQKVHKTAVPNRVQMTESTYKLLEPQDTYSMYVRGNINVKDFAVYKVYWLNGRRISTGTSDCESTCSRIGSWIEIERKPLYRLDEVEGVYEPIDKPKNIFYSPLGLDV